MKEEVANAAMAATLEALRNELQSALTEVDHAVEYIGDGERGATVGTLSYVETSVRRANEMITAIKAVNEAVSWNQN